MCGRRKSTFQRKEQPRAQATETGKRNNYRQDQSTPALPSRLILGEAAGRRSSTSWRWRPLAGYPTPVGYTHIETRERGGAGGRGRSPLGQSHAPLHCPTAGGANGREAAVLLALPPSPRLPQYTMAPKEGPLAARPK